MRRGDIDAAMSDEEGSHSLPPLEHEFANRPIFDITPPQARALFALRPCPCQVDHRPEPIYVDLHHLHSLEDGGSRTGPTVPACANIHQYAHHIGRVFKRMGGPTRRQPRWPHYAYQLAVTGWELAHPTSD